MRTRHVALALGLTATLAVVPVRTLAPPAAAAISPALNAYQVAAALQTPSAWVRDASLSQGSFDFEGLVTSAGTADAPLAGFPTEGSTFTILTTGDAAAADDPSGADDPATRADDLGMDWDSQFGDRTRLRLDLQVADNATCLTFDYKFLTEEHGEATVSADWFAAALLEDPAGPDADARQMVRTSSFTPGLTPAAAAGTPYDAATATIRGAVPIPAPRLALTLTVDDVSDGIADSAVFVDNLQAGRPVGGTCTTGVALDHHEVTLSPRKASTAVGSDQQVAVRLLDHSQVPAAVVGEQLVVNRSGANPGTERLISDDPAVTSTWSGADAGVDTVSACWDADESGDCEPGELTETRAANITWTDGRRPRIAFTDDTDTVAAVEVTRDEADRLTTGFAPSPWNAFSEHSGELSAMDGDLVGVSTHQEDAGEVYLRADGGSWVRVTCDTFRETHPAVFSSRNLVAYASDADGDWDVYVAYRAGSFDTEIGRVASSWMLRRPRAAAPAAALPAAESSACPGTSWTHVNLTPDSPGDDLWPTWGPGGRLVWSSTTDDPLGDLYTRRVSSFGVWGPVTRLTDDPAADTQPAVADIDETIFVAFTTTRFSADGSVAALELDGDGTVDQLVPVAQGTSSEPAWSSAFGARHLAWTSRARDVDGDIMAAGVSLSGTSGTGLVLGTSHDVRARPGVAETHAAWVREIGAPDEPGTIAFTSRSQPADVSDVHAEDGTDRRVLADRELPDIELPSPLDEGAPAYSPDGDRIVYSSGLSDPWPSGSDNYQGHELRVMDADGGASSSLAASTGREAGDVDVDPVWSHDGSRIAWTRYAAGSTVSHVWIADLDEGTAWRATRTPPGMRVQDLTPSWSPDDQWLVVARATSFIPSVAPSAVPTFEPVNTVLTLLRADESGDSIALVRPGTADDPSALRGRTPAWAPDGSRIAYSRGPQLEIVELAGTTPPAAAHTTGVWEAADHDVLVGFDGPSGDGDWTAARETLESGDDPDWMPDGDRLVFSGQPAGQPDRRGLYLIAADPDAGGEPLPLTDEPGPDTEPASQPRQADIGVTVSVADSPALVGAPVTATFTVTNHGPGYAPAVTLTTSYAPGATTSSAGPPAGCAADGSGCAVPVLAPGASFAYSVSVVHPAPVDGAAQGTVSTAAADPVPANDTAQAPYAVVPSPGGPSADVAVTVSVIPTPAVVGGPLEATFTVTNLGPSTAESVTLSTTLPGGGTAEADSPPAGCAGDGSGCSLGSLAPGASTAYVVDLSYPAPVTGEVRGTAVSTTPDPQIANNTAVAPLEVVAPSPTADLAVTVTLDASTGWVGGSRTATVVVRNKGPEAAAKSRLRLSFPEVVEMESSTPEGTTPACEAGQCALGTLEPGARLVWTVVLRPSAEGQGDIAATVSSATADPELRDNVARERLTVLQPLVSVLPGVSRPGKAVLVFGEDMPPGTEVLLSWSKGIMTAPGPYVVEDDGTFTQPVFVLRRDRLGKRRIRVTSVTEDFSPVGAPLLVAYPLMVPVGEIEDRG